MTFGSHAVSLFVALIASSVPKQSDTTWSTNTNSSDKKKCLTEIQHETMV